MRICFGLYLSKYESKKEFICTLSLIVISRIETINRMFNTEKLLASPLSNCSLLIRYLEAVFLKILILCKSHTVLTEVMSLSNAYETDPIHKVRM